MVCALSGVCAQYPNLIIIMHQNVKLYPKKTKNSCKYCVFIKNKLNMTKRVEIEALAYRAASDF